MYGGVYFVSVTGNDSGQDTAERLFNSLSNFLKLLFKLKNSFLNSKKYFSGILNFVIFGWILSVWLDSEAVVL